MSIGKEVRRENHEQTDKKKRELEVLAILNEHGRLCGEQVLRIMGVSNPNCARPRLSEMHTAGKVREVGKIKNSYGKPETVYEITEKGKAALRGANAEDGSKENNSIDRITPESEDVNGP